MAALRQISPVQEHRDLLRLPTQVISAAMRAQTDFLGKSRASTVQLLSVAAVIRIIDEERGDSTAEVAYSGYLPCDEPPEQKSIGGRGVAVTTVHDGLRKGAPADTLEATVWMQLLVLPGTRIEQRAGPSPCGVETRRVKFILRGEEWIKE